LILSAFCVTNMRHAGDTTIDLGAEALIDNH
jgi:hypothetical protein